MLFNRIKNIYKTPSSGVSVLCNTIKFENKMIVKNYFVLALNIVFLSAYAANVVQFQPAAIEYMQG